MMPHRMGCDEKRRELNWPHSVHLCHQRASARAHSRRWHVSLVVVLEVMVSSLSGLYDVLNCFELLGSFDDAVPASPLFTVEFVSARRGRVVTASGLPVEAHRALCEVTATDIVIVPSLLVEHAHGYRDATPKS